MKRKLTSVLLCAVLLFSLCGVSAFADMRLVPGGEAVGIRIDIGGVVVAELNELETDSGSYSPAERAGIKKGDIISAVNGHSVSDASAFITQVDGMDGSNVTITLLDGSSERNVEVTPAKCPDGTYRLGVWLRDSLSGIGTMTYYDPDTGAYGALGHGVSDGEVDPIVTGEGTLAKAQVVDVIKGQEGTPGELCGSVEDTTLGTIDRNTDRGIFGTLDTWDAAGAISVGSESDIHLGPATVLSTINSDGVKPYDVEISRVYHDPGNNRSMMITVTDPALLAATGGIVQGMSGSPIIQDGKLIGAVTHVLVSDPTRGYGISIENMLEAA